MLDRLRWLPRVLVFATFVAPLPAAALQVTEFGPNGEGGIVNGQLFNLGSGGQVHELDAFVRLGAQDLNGTAGGIAAQLSLDPLPGSLTLNFSAALFGNDGILMTYELENVSGSALADLSFLSFLDAEIVEVANTFFNEFVDVSGSAAAAQGWEVDEPGFTTGDLFDNLLAGALDGTNALPQGTPDDVAMALSFVFPALLPGEIAQIQVLISEAGDSLGGIVLTQRDPDNPTTITYSGAAVVIPEPGTAGLLGLGIVLLAAHQRAGRGCA